MNRNTLGNPQEVDVAKLRKNYTSGGLIEANLPDNPVEFFKIWLNQAVSADVPEPNAMSLATVSEDGTPGTRIVLLKGIGERSIQFYTNYNSKKGKALGSNPYAAVNFWWAELERQVRMKGDVAKVSRKESDQYFQSRPRESQLGAWASNQSSEIADRAELKKSFEEVSRKFGDNPIPTPDFWGGFKIKVSEIEFWQGRPGRLHDRILYTFEDGTWTFKRLQP